MEKKNANGFKATDIYGPDGKTNLKKEEKKENEKLTFKGSIKVLKGMLQYCTFKDRVLLVLGLCCAVVNGVVNPVSAFVLGKVVNYILEVIFIRSKGSQAVTNIVLNGSQINSTNFNPVVYSYDPFIPNEDFEHLNLSSNALYYLIIGIISLTSAFTEIYCWEVTCEKVVLRLRKRFLSQVLRQDLEWFDKAETGDLTTRLTDDLERVRDGFGAKVALLLQLAVMILSGFIFGLCLNWRFALVLAIATPILFANAILASSITAQTAIVEQIKYSEAGAIANEVLSGIRTVAAFGGESLAKARYDKALDEGRRLTLNKYYGLAVAISINYGSLMIMYAIGLYYGSYLYLWGYIDVGTMTSVFSCLIQAAFTAALCLPILVDIGTALGAAASIIPTVQRIPSIDPYAEHGHSPNDVAGEIVFDNVKFAYPTRPGMLVLKGMTLTIPAGKIVAMVGSSGAGKSTIVNLLLHFYELTSGNILLDGISVKDLNVKWLRRQVGIVSQEPVLFRVSIAENIRYGREDATMDDIIKAAKQANAHNFIMSLPQRYETEVGDRGTQISGGQKQRIAIARALVKDPKILLLDEATSALDSQSEAIVQQALDNAMQGRTTIIIAHRLSTVRNANLICAMRDGVVEEVGTHESLMDRQGLYYDLVMLQSQMDEKDTPNVEQRNEDEEIQKMNFARKLSVYSSTSSAPSPEVKTVKDKIQFKALFSVKGTPWLRISIGLLLFFICGLAEPSLAYIYTRSVQVFLITDKDDFKAEIVKWVGGLGGVGICVALCLLFGVLLCAISTETMVQVFRVKMFKNMLSQQVCWFDHEENAPNRVSNLLAREPPLVKAILGGKFGMLVKCVLNIGLAIVISYVCNWKLAFITLIVFSIIIFSSLKSLRLQVRALQKESDIVQIGFKLAAECIQNIKTVQQIGLQDLLVARYESMADQASRNALKQALLYGTSYTLSSALVIFLNSGLCQFGNMLLKKYDIPPSNLLMLIFLASFTCPVIPAFAHFFNDFAKGMDPLKRVSKALHLKDENFDTFSEDGILPEIKGKIEFKNVKFTYPTRRETPILKGLNLTIERGQTVALVGPSGCGKSTTISLLERFYSPDSGTVTVDDVDIKDINLGYLRSNIGLVTQEPTLFDCSIRKNIAYGVLGEEPSDGEIITAAKMANIHDFISSLPKGYDTPVGDKGAQMSGGQKQRIAIARALIRNPKILLLDEATSALDNHSEKVVQEALERAQEGRSCIIIAHRLSTIQNADKIVVISNGRVVEQGTHHQLIRSEGIYFDMVNRQQNLANED